MSVPKPTGPVPKPSDKRRRTNKPASYGLAEPLKAGVASVQPPELGIPNAHEMITSLWAALGTSVEAQFYSAADWQRVRLELWYANRLMRSRGRVSSQGWGVLQSGLGDLLVSPADKRRIGIELERAAEDPDEDAAVLQMVDYQEKLAGS